MINVQNDLPEESSVVVDGLESPLIPSCLDALTIEMFCKKLNHWCEKLKTKMNNKSKEKILVTYGKPFKGRCIKCRDVLPKID